MTATSTAQAPSRLAFVDNLRWAAIALVITMHAAVTYSNFGRWYFLEPAPTGQLTLLFFGIYQSFLQAWFMGLLFLLAGYFVPASFDRKGARRFLADRAVRLGIPSLIYALLISPFIIWWMLPRFRTGQTGSFGAAWLRYVVRFRFIGETGPLWFAVALLIFCLVYAGVRVLRPTPHPAAHWKRLPDSRSVLMLIGTMWLCTFLVRVVQPIGTAIANMQLCYFSQYILLFIIGILARRGNWLLRIPRWFAMRWFVAAQLGGTAIWLATIIGGGALSGAGIAVFNGGWHWQSAAMSSWESFYCVGTSLGLIVLFREWFNTQTRLTRFLSDNAFAVYVFHAPILIGVTMALHPLAAPAIVRFALASILAVAASFLASGFLFRRIPFLKAVL